MMSCLLTDLYKRCIYHSASFLSTTPRIVLYSLIRKRIILLNLRFSSSSPASLVRVDTHINVRVIYEAMSIFLSRPRDRSLDRFFMPSLKPNFSYFLIFLRSTITSHGFAWQLITYYYQSPPNSKPFIHFQRHKQKGIRMISKESLDGNRLFTMMSSNLNMFTSNLSASKFPLRSKEKEFTTRELIGRGSFGEVEKCESIENGKVYAIKTIMVNRLYLDSIEEEAKNMRLLNSEYVLELVDSFYDDHLGSYVLVTPYYKLGSFEQLMGREWDLEELLLFFYQMAKAHFELSKNGICHLDLKPENILLQSPTQYVLCDLGCSRKLEQQGNMASSFNALKISTNTRGGGTTEYGSPDLVINGEMTDFSDIWSLGVILYKIIFKKHPLMTLPNSYSQKLNSFLKGDIRIEYPQNERSNKFAPVVELLKRMLVCSRNKEMRIKWDQILERIYKIVGIPSAQRPYIITNFDCLLHFADQVMVLLSALLHYIDQFKDTFSHAGLETKVLSRQICIYLLTVTKELVTHTGDVHQDFWMFYLFEVTRRNLTKKQRSYAQHLAKEALRLAADRGVNEEYENLLIFWERVVVSCGKLYKAVSALTPPKNAGKQVELKKIIQISNFIAFENKLQYKNKRRLQEFVAKLINS